MPSRDAIVSREMLQKMLGDLSDSNSRKELDLGGDVSRLVWSQRHSHGNDHNVEWSTVLIVVRIWLKV